MENRVHALHCCSLVQLRCGKEPYRKSFLLTTMTLYNDFIGTESSAPTVPPSVGPDGIFHCSMTEHVAVSESTECVDVVMICLCVCPAPR